MPRKGHAAALALAACLLVARGPAVANPAEPRQQLNEIEKGIAQSRTQQRSLREDADRLQREAAVVGQKLAEIAQRVQEAEARLTEAEGHAQALRTEIVAQDLDLQAHREELARLAETLVRLARQPPATALLAPSGMLQALRNSRLLAAVGEGIAAQVTALNLRLARLAERERDLATEQARLATERGTLALERGRLADLLRQREAEERQTRQAGQQEAILLAGLSSQAVDLRQLVRQLEEEAQARRAEVELARQAEEARQRAEVESRRLRQLRDQQEQERQTAEASAARLAATLPSVQPFAKARGQIMPPVRGEVISLFGESNAAGQRMRGIRLAARADAAVVAPYHGRVAFAGPFRDYGLVLILAHGDGYHVLLAGLAKLYTEVGRTVQSGEPVGEMGRGESERTLYLEVRAKGEPIDPLPWIAAPKGKVSG